MMQAVGGQQLIGALCFQSPVPLSSTDPVLFSLTWFEKSVVLFLLTLPVIDLV